MNRRRLAVTATILVFLLGVMLVGLVPFRQILNQRQAVAAAETRLGDLEAENARLARHVEALETPIEIERRAREDFGLVRPGETAYIVVPVAPVAVEEPAATDDPGGFWQSILDFFTGTDDGD